MSVKGNSDCKKTQYKQSEQMKARLINKKYFPKTNQIMKLDNFVNENVKMHEKLLIELQELKEYKNRNEDVQNNNKMQKKQSSRSVGSQKNIEVQSMTQDNLQLKKFHSIKVAQLQQLKQQLQYLQQKNRKQKDYLLQMQQQQVNRSIHQTPLLKQKHQEIELKSIEIESLNQKNQHLRTITKSNDVFNMYEKMCRECETLRKQNNSLSQKLKGVFQKMNKVTGKEENVNMFLMNLKV